MIDVDLFWALKARKQNSDFVVNVKENFNCIGIRDCFFKIIEKTRIPKNIN